MSNNKTLRDYKMFKEWFDDNLDIITRALRFSSISNSQENNKIYNNALNTMPTTASYTPIYFHVVMAHEYQRKIENIDLAFEEFFVAKSQYEDDHSPYLPGEELPPPDPELGTKGNKFVASNGVTIFYTHDKNEII